MNKTSASLEWMKILGLDKCQLATWVNNFLCFSLILVLVFPCTTTYVDHLFRIWKKNNLTRWKFMLDQTTYERKKKKKNKMKSRWERRKNRIEWKNLLPFLHFFSIVLVGIQPSSPFFSDKVRVLTLVSGLHSVHWLFSYRQDAKHVYKIKWNKLCDEECFKLWRIRRIYL